MARSKQWQAALLIHLIHILLPTMCQTLPGAGERDRHARCHPCPTESTCSSRGWMQSGKERALGMHLGGCPGPAPKAPRCAKLRNQVKSGLGGGQEGCQGRKRSTGQVSMPSALSVQGFPPGPGQGLSLLPVTWGHTHLRAR